MNDQEFVKKALLGDRDAYGALIDSYQGMVYVVALNITKDYTESEDIVQEAFLRAWENLSSLSDPSRFSSWLYTLTKRLALRFLKQKGRISASCDEDADIDKIDSLSQSPSDEASRKEINALLWKEVQSLPAKTREAILLYYVEGFSTVKAAEFLGIDESAFRMRLKFGREKLRDALMEKIEGELRRHQPNEKTKKAILASLPFVRIPKPPASTPETTPVSQQRIIPKETPAPRKSPFLPSSTFMPKFLIPFALLTIGIVFYFVFFHNPGIEPTNSTPVLKPQNTQVDASVNNFKSPEESPAPLSPKNESAMSTAPGFLLEGTIVEKDTMMPIPMIAVSLHQKDRMIRKLVTDSSGVARFPDLPEGTYRVFLEPGRSSLSDEYFFDTYIKGVTVRIPGRDIRNMVIPLKPAISISGRVLDPNSRPVEGAQIYLSMGILEQPEISNLYMDRMVEIDSMVPGKSSVYYIDRTRPPVLTGSDGAFKFSNLTPELPYYILCSAPGYCKISVDNIIPQKSKPVKDLVVQIDKGTGATVTGKAVNEEGAPVEQVLLTATLYETGSGALPPAEMKLAYESSFLTDETGGFVFRNVPPGSLSLNEYLGRCNPPMQVSIEPGKSDIQVDVILKGAAEPGVLSGIVLDENGVPFRGGVVHALQGGQANRGIGFVQNDGRFRISNLPEGVPLMLMYAPSRLSSWMPTDAVDVLASTENLKVARTGKPEFSQTPGGKSGSMIKARGNVIDRETQKGIEFFSIQNYTDSTPADFPSWFYDEEGYFELEDLEYKHGAENYLCARTEGYRDNYKKVLWGDGGRINEYVFRMRYTPVRINIDGWVLDSLDKPIPGVKITLNGLNQPAVFTDETGAFSFSFEDEGYIDYHYPLAASISAEHPDFATWQSPEPLMLNSLNDDDIQIRDYEIRLVSGGVLQGSVTDEKGKGIDNVTINIKHIEDGGNTRKTVSGMDGKYYQRSIPPGIYSVTAEAPVSNQKMVNIEEGKSAILNFTLEGGVLFGKVFSGKEPLNEAQIFLSDSADEDLPAVFSAKAVTGEDGSYEIRGIPEGDYFLSLRKNSIYMILPLHISTNERLEKNIPIQFGSIRGRVIFGKSPKSFQDLRVTLSQTEAAFSLIPGLDMTEMSSPCRSETVDPEGNFSFEQVPSGRYILCCKTEDRGSVSLEIVLEPEQELRDVLLRFPDTGSLEIRLIDAETGRSMNLQGSLLLKDDGQHMTERDIHSGFPIVDGINIGSYSIYAIGGDEEKNFYLSEGMEDALVEAEKTNSVTLRMKPGKQIEIQVIDTNGELLGNCEAFLYDSEGSWQPIIIMRGSAIMGMAPVGEFKLVLFRSGIKFREIPLTIPPDSPGNIFRKTITLD